MQYHLEASIRFRERRESSFLISCKLNEPNMCCDVSDLCIIIFLYILFFQSHIETEQVRREERRGKRGRKNNKIAQKRAEI